MHQTQENMDFHENTDSVNDTEVIESLFTPYTDEPIAPSDYAITEYHNEDPDGLLQRLLLTGRWFNSTRKLVGMFSF